MDDRRTIFLDTETHRFGPSRMAPPIVCIQVAEQGAVDIFTGEDARREFGNLIRLAAGGEARIVGHRISYDMACAASMWPEYQAAIWEAYRRDSILCTRVIERLLDIHDGIRRKVHLDKLAHRYLGTKLEKGEIRTDFARVDGVPLESWPGAYRQYAELDVIALRDVYHAQAKRAREASYDCPTWALEARACFALRLATCWGMGVDRVAVENLSRALIEKMKALADDLSACGVLRVRRESRLFGGETFETSANLAAVRELVERSYPGDPPRTATGEIKTSAETIAACNDSRLVTYREFKDIEKTLSFVAKLEGGDVFPDFDAMGANSDRTSCSNPNVQQMPRAPGVRECFAPRRGNVFVSADYDTQEVRTFAQATKDVTGRSRLAERFQQDRGYDPHTEFAEAMRANGFEGAGRQEAKVCFHPDTEVLTLDGWKKIEALEVGEQVAIAFPQREGECVLHWDSVLATTRRKSPGTLIHLQNKGIDLRVTPDHRMLGFKNSGDPYVTTALEFSKARRWSNSGVLNSSYYRHGNASLRLLQLAVAAQADGSYAGANSIRFGFSKKRKIDRMRSLLSEHEGWSEHKRGKVVSFLLKSKLGSEVRALLTPDKKIPWWWLRLDFKHRRLVIDESMHWDGSRTGKQVSFYYSSRHRQNVDVLQAIASISGLKAKVKSRDGQWNLAVADHGWSRGGSVKATEQKYGGDVVCLTVASSFVLVRDKGIPTVQGQCNFGLPGGMGARKLVLYARGMGVTITEEQAHRMKNLWRNQWPETRLYFDAIGSLVASGSGTVTIKQTGFKRGGCGYTDAANTHFQTRAAQASKTALFDVSRACYADPSSPLYGSRIVNFIHDEILLESPEDIAPEAGEELARLMIAAAERTTTPDVPASASAVLMRRWSKGAKPVRDGGGRLKVWE